MAQQNHLGKTATSIYTEDGFTSVIYHSTCVVRWNEKTIILDSGEWKTQTTKTRMNQASCEFGLGFTVLQQDFEWFVIHKGKTHRFYDRMELKR